jgi:hypothetical protein
MPWVTIRSRRAPACWAPIAVVLVVVVPLGVRAQSWVTEYLRRLEAIRESDPVAARVAAEQALRTFGWLSCGFVLVIATVFARYFWLGLRQERLPPAGWWSLGAYRAATGATAERIARAGLVLALLLALLGVGSVFLVMRLIGALSGRPAA